MSTEKRAHVIAFYLPQYHPIPENDEWWGKGFTEWTNVAKAKPMFRGHYQPIVPADLGFYDLRLADVREEQAQMARDAGIDAFCYWHYWFGNGKELLERPFNEVVSSGKPDFPFCIGWANHSWMKKRWNNDVSRFCQDLLIEQHYPGKEDIVAHFYSLLPAFKDKRYYHIHGKLLFVVYSPVNMPDTKLFMDTWQELAAKNNLPPFYFIGQGDVNQIKDPIYKMYDAINLESIRTFFNQSRMRRIIAYTLRHPITQPYKAILKKYDMNLLRRKDIIATLYANWDNTSRIGYIGTVFTNPEPVLFKKHIEQIIENTGREDKLIFLKSWNEWGEGNYVEPCLKYGHGYLNALKECILTK
ncbi:MAG: glycoside hydrolase family 99-like domain-containing protein [Paludibacteraceae bacterium]|nr:glycoside hydrolase family 99-like domain-containing protein [Paludibacteraceae bacterium]